MTEQKLHFKHLLTQLAATVLTIFLSVQCAEAISARYHEYLAQGKIVPTFVLIFVVWLIGMLFSLVVTWIPERLGLFWLIKTKLSFLRVLSMILCCALPGVLYNFMRFCEPYGDIWIRIFLFSFAILFGAWILEKENRVSFSSLIYSAITASAAFALLYQFHDVSSYPFSIGWSEGNRMWDYSILFGRALYNFPADQPIPAYIDIGRQSLWGLIFLLPNVNIILMRIWNDFLFTIPCAILGWLLFKSQRKSSFVRWLCLGLWVMLFLMQGPIYTPLIIAAILIVLGRRTPVWLSCLLTAAAGFYAVMSRSTWVAGPAFFAVLLSFIPPEKTSAKKRWTRSIAVGVSGFVGAILYMKRDFFGGLVGWTGSTEAIQAASDTSAAAAAMTAVPPIFTPAWFGYYFSRQPLLWDRLWPNETFSTGIVLGLLLAVLPAFLILVIWLFQRHWALDCWQRILLIAGSAIFMGVGIIISVKIGGGSNLHNLDMFLIAFVIIIALAWDAGMGEWLIGMIQKNHIVSLIVLAAILIPAYNALSNANPRALPRAETTADALEKVQTVVAEHADEDILFLDQRQLLTFGNVPAIPLIPDYEKKWMMDEAMADNAEFFAPYIRDLKMHRFAVIISEPLHIKFQGSGENFSEENDLFVKWVSLPTLCYYEPYETFAEQGVQILIPRAETLNQEGVVCP